MNVVINQAARIALSSEPDERVVLVGKDILELLSSAMYVHPLTIYREYVQNSADAIDDAVAAGVLQSIDEGSIEVRLNQADRRAIIRDNGIGLSNDAFAKQMLSFGASEKRGRDYRGFRGVGRLAGLGYVQQLIFRSRSAGDNAVLEAIWDGHVVKRLLGSQDAALDLAAIVRQVVSIKRIDPTGYPEHFFEVELVKPRRIGTDFLLNETEIGSFLAQVCPCPLSPDFEYASEIEGLLKPHGSAGRNYKIFVNGSDTPVYRPYQNTVIYSELKSAKIGAFRAFEVAGIDGGLAAVGWLCHHDYEGAIPTSQGVRGLRARVGNIQVGNDRLFAGIFPEDRFCSWTIGEVHILDPRVIPNGRRDEFEANGHLDNIFMHLRPIASDIARECRTSSQRRARLKTFELGAEKVAEKIEIIKQGAVSERYAKAVRGEVGTILAEMKKASSFELLNNDEREDLKVRYNEVERKVDDFSKRNDGGVIENLPKSQRRLYEEVFDLIYDCSANQVVAKSLIDRMLERLSRK